MDLKHRKIVGILIILVFISGEFTPFLSGFYSVVSADVQPPRSSRNLKE